MTAHPPVRQSHQSLEKTITKVLAAKYLLYLPQGYEEGDEAWPLMLFLHGAGERGDDLERLKILGPPKIAEERQDFPFVLVSPQCPADEWWSIQVLDALLDEIIAGYRIDEDRVYLTGVSMGGYGAWMLAGHRPDRFAALVPICGGGLPPMTQKMVHIPVWVFHGAKDDMVPIERSRVMVDTLRGFGGNVKFTIYPEAKHDSWTETYDNPDLYEWLLEQRRGGGE
ncbi:MAG: prolyl oligopeptidase family serine peptidase [Armatimonadota bacterium]|jgi:predicted peptidase